MNKEFERCCTFLAEMIEKYGLDAKGVYKSVKEFL